MIAMEGLDYMIRTKNNQFAGWIRDFDVAGVGNDSLKATHLQRIDNTHLLL